MGQERANLTRKLSDLDKTTHKIYEDIVDLKPHPHQQQQQQLTVDPHNGYEHQEFPVKLSTPVKSFGPLTTNLDDFSLIDDHTFKPKPVK